jgi:hypothetical protein
MNPKPLPLPPSFSSEGPPEGILTAKAKKERKRENHGRHEPSRTEELSKRKFVWSVWSVVNFL